MSLGSESHGTLDAGTRRPEENAPSVTGFGVPTCATKQYLVRYNIQTAVFRCGPRTTSRVGKRRAYYYCGSRHPFLARIGITLYIYILICAPRLYFPTREGVSILSRTFGNLRLPLQFGLFLGIRKILIQESGDRQRYTNIQHPCQSDRVRLVVAECGLLYFFFCFCPGEREETLVHSYLSSFRVPVRTRFVSSTLVGPVCGRH